MTMMWSRCLTGIFVINILTVYAYPKFYGLIEEFQKLQDGGSETRYKAKKEIENGNVYNNIIPTTSLHELCCRLCLTMLNNCFLDKNSQHT